MKITLRILRIICKLLLLVYVTAVNLVFILFFYLLVILIAEWIAPSFMKALLDSGWKDLVYNMPLLFILFYILYSISPVGIWVMRMNQGYRPLYGEDKARINRLLSETGIKRKLKVYRNKQPQANACAFGFNTIGITIGTMQTATDEELKGIICHEAAHIAHYDYIYSILLYSMELPGHRCLYGIFYLFSYIFIFTGSLLVAISPSLGSVAQLLVDLWWKVYRLCHYIIYGISKLINVNINKYAEYRCDAYSVRYGCGTGLLSFLKRLDSVPDSGKQLSFSEYIMTTHPSTEYRIIRLEKLLN